MFKPTIITDASSIPSGRSCDFLNLEQESNIEDSSVIVPLSERTAFAFINLHSQVSEWFEVVKWRKRNSSSIILFLFEDGLILELGFYIP